MPSQAAHITTIDEVGPGRPRGSLDHGGSGADGRPVARRKVSGKCSKTRYVPLHPAASGLIVDYFEADALGLETTGALFRAVGNRAGGWVKAITEDAIYSAVLGFEVGAHLLRATAAANALDNQADIAKVQE